MSGSTNPTAGSEKLNDIYQEIIASQNHNQLDQREINVEPSISTASSKSVYVFIDNSNIQIDNGKLLKTVLNNRLVGADPIIVGLRPRPDDTLWKIGFNTSMHETRSSHAKEMHNYIAGTIHKHKPGIILIVAENGGYGSVIGSALEKTWIVELWLWSQEFSNCLKTDINELIMAAKFSTTIVNLDNYNKDFHECNNTVEIKYLEIFTDKIGYSTMKMECCIPLEVECYIPLELFDWWGKPNQNTLKLYVDTFKQWKDIKDLIMHKYPGYAILIHENATDAFFIEKDTFFKMYLS